MEKILDMKKNVFALVQEYPEISDILYELGFQDIVKPGMLNTAGRFMTIPKGAVMKKINMNEIEATFEKRGFTILR